MSLTCQRRSAGPVEYQGLIEFDERVMAFEMAGRVRDVTVQRGDLVEDKGVLARLDDALQALTVQSRLGEEEAARAALALLVAGPRGEEIAALDADVHAAGAQVDLTRKTFDRVQALVQTGAVGPVELDRATADLKQANFQYRSLAQKLRALQAGARSEEIARARASVEASAAAAALEQERLARYVLRAAGAGVVVDVLVKSGEMAAVGTPAVKVADVKRPTIDVFVPEGRLDGIGPAAHAALRVDATSASFRGVVDFVSPRTEFTPRFLFSDQERPQLVIRVRVRIEDPDARLHAGVPGFVRFE